MSRIIVNICGDIVDANRGRETIKTGNAFSKEVTEIFGKGNLNIVNLECPIIEKSKGQKIIKTGPHLQGNEDMLSFLKKSNINLVTIANNHIRDYGDEGIGNTISLCKKYGINYVGICDNKNNSFECYKTEINGKKIAIFNYCENEFSVHTLKESYSATPINPCANYSYIQKVKNEGYYTIMILHCGMEMNQYPSPQTKQLCRFYVEIGADAVVCHHPHCFSGYELYKNAPIFYSTGNFYFDNPSYNNSIWNEGYVVQLVLDEKIEFNIIPYYQCNDEPIVVILENEKKEEFYRKIEEINKIIKDDVLLEDKFEKWCTIRDRYYLSMCVSLRGSLLQRLLTKTKMPIPLSKKEALLLFDLIRCESHRYLLINSLQNYIYKK